MPTPEAVTGIFITLKVEDEQALFVLLSSDGTVNRAGTGSDENVENDLFIGRTSPEMFEALKSRIRPEALQWEGGYAAPDPAGQTCELTVGFMHNDDSESGCRFRYGSESQGPPEELCDLVMAAIEITNPWYEEQKRMVSGG
jgi:hypothetical protein